METLIKADIFFFVTTIAVVVFLILGSLALLQLIRLLKSVRRMSERLEGDLQAIEDGAENLYERISQSFLFNLIFAKKGTKRAKQKDL